MGFDGTDNTIKPLVVSDLVDLIAYMKTKYTREELSEMRVFAGDDEELNGVHLLYFAEEVYSDALLDLVRCSAEIPPGNNAVLLFT